MNLEITPDTKVGALLEAYPGIEEKLVAWVPAFSKLKNPILRKTVAKVATLEQAAKVGGVSARDLVRKLREEIGQADLPVLETPTTSTAASASGPPAWLREERVRFDIDADSMLERGEHPIGKIRGWAAALEPGDIIRLTSSFRPAPLIDTMMRSGLAVHTSETAPGSHVTYFSRK